MAEATIRDVAREAQVSVASVSRVLPPRRLSSRSVARARNAANTPITIQTTTMTQRQRIRPRAILSLALS